MYARPACCCTRRCLCASFGCKRAAAYGCRTITTTGSAPCAPCGRIISCPCIPVRILCSTNPIRRVCLCWNTWFPC